MLNPSARPRILVVTPEVVFVPGSAGKRDNCKEPLRTGFAGFLTRLISHLFELGADVHAAQPDYHKIFAALLQDKQNTVGSKIPGSRIHLAEDRRFFYSNSIDSNSEWENQDIAIAFQREVNYLSGILAATHVNAANPTLLSDISRGRNEVFETHLRQVLAQKFHAGCAGEIFSLADPFSKTASNKKQHCYYSPNVHQARKQGPNRIMDRRSPPFSHRDTAQHYINLYELMLQRPLVQVVESFSKP